MKARARGLRLVGAPGRSGRPVSSDVHYYVVAPDPRPGVGFAVIAEVVSPGEDAQAATRRLAVTIAGPRSRILTGEELSADAAGQRALEEWEHAPDMLALEWAGAAVTVPRRLQRATQTGDLGSQTSV